MMQELKDKMEMASLYEKTLGSIAEGEILKGKVVKVGNTDVLIDIGFKSEGAVPIREFDDKSEVKIGDEVNVLVERIEDQKGYVILSKWRADQLKGWEQVTRAFEKGEIIEGTVCRQIKGGFNVDIGVEAFLPSSQVQLRSPSGLNRLIGQKLPFKIVNLNRAQRNIIVSHRMVKEDTEREARDKLLAEIEVGQRRRGKVRGITNFGAFIDLGGLDGLLHITDMSWDRISHPSEMVAIGDEVEVMVLDFDKEKKRVSLGLKQKTENPWDKIEEKYPIGSTARGKVVNITPYGSFIKLEEGIEGLLHISEMSWTKRINHPSEVLAMEETVAVVILSISKEEKKISLGMKQLETNPWKVIEEKYPAGTVLEGKIRNLTDYGAFIELEGGIDGLIHISDLSWSKKIEHPSEIVEKGKNVKAVVLEVNSERKKISLGLKQLTADPWLTIDEKYKIGDIVSGEITKITDFGVFIELEDGIEGLVHNSELPVASPSDAISIGNTVKSRVLKVSPEERKIRLSLKDV
jgi:small subunit ribosomal protein S1